MRLKDKVAIITGGSRGIGFATADKEKYPNAIVAGISPNLASMESVRKAFKETSEKYWMCRHTGK